MKDFKSVTYFFLELKIIWKELEIYMPIPNCNYRIRCSCEAMTKARSNHNLLYVIKFLTSLNENFALVKSQILLMDLLLVKSKIFFMV